MQLAYSTAMRAHTLTIEPGTELPAAEHWMPTRANENRAARQLRRMFSCNGWIRSLLDPLSADHATRALLGYPLGLIPCSTTPNREGSTEVVAKAHMFHTQGT